jgi:hypothetical protein
MYQPGDRVVYTAYKHSTHPGPRAEAIQPETNGEGYSYDVKKYWVVVQVRDDSLTVVTRRGKERAVAATDPRLRPARWWETFFFRGRFPPADFGSSPGQPSRSSAA